MIALVALALLQAVPPPLPLRTADCARPVYASDRLVCTDPDLRRVDAELALALARGGERTGRWIEDGEAWFRRSRMCAMKVDHRQCLVEAYQERRVVLGAPVTGDRGRPCGVLRTAAMPDGNVALYEDDGRLAGVALRPSRAWTPFVRIATARRFLDLAGKELGRCG